MLACGWNLHAMLSPLTATLDKQSRLTTSARQCAACCSTTYLQHVHMARHNHCNIMCHTALSLAQQIVGMQNESGHSTPFCML